MLPFAPEDIGQPEGVEYIRHGLSQVDVASVRKGANLRAPPTAKTQGGAHVTRVDWTPIFARGKLRLYVCDADAARLSPELPDKVCDSRNLAKLSGTSCPTSSRP